jgi:hypothetical protein
MRKLTKASLSELAKSKEIISFLDQKSYIGGGTGTRHDPYSIEEYNSLIDNSNWNGGWVLKDQDSNPIYVGGTQADTEESYNGGTDFSGGTKYNGGTDGNGDVAYDGKTRYDGGTNGDVPYDGKTKYDGGTFENRDNPHGLDEVVAIGHRPSNPNPALGYDSMSINYNYTGSTHSIPSYDSNYASGGTYVTNAGGGGNIHGSSGNSGQSFKDNDSPILPIGRLEEIKKFLTQELYDLLKSFYDQGMVRVNTDPRYTKNSGYYDGSVKKIFFQEGSTMNPSTHAVAHELTHYFQDLDGVLPIQKDDYTGSLNCEMQADIIGTICAFGRQGDLTSNCWLSDDTKKMIKDELDVDKKGNVTISKNLWNKLNDNNFMLQLQREWREYQEIHHPDSDTYLKGEQMNWNYNWKYYFESLKIKIKGLK